MIYLSFSISISKLNQDLDRNNNTAGKYHLHHFILFYTTLRMQNNLDEYVNYYKVFEWLATHKKNMQLN